jgi:hypothetical protein
MSSVLGVQAFAKKAVYFSSIGSANADLFPALSPVLAWIVLDVGVGARLGQATPEPGASSLSLVETGPRRTALVTRTAIVGLQVKSDA